MVWKKKVRRSILGDIDRTFLDSSVILCFSLDVRRSSHFWAWAVTPINSDTKMKSAGTFLMLIDLPDELGARYRIFSCFTIFWDFLVL